ncbi:MAG: proprotein convertase P-domain-containing protein [Pseudomonadota bacterium]
MKFIKRLAITSVPTLLLAGAAHADILLAGPGLNLDIPDDDPVGASVTVVASGGMTVETIAVAVSIDHTWVGDHIWTLTSPSGTSVVLMDRPGGVDGGVGDSTNLSSEAGVILDDRFQTPVEEAGADPCDSSDFLGNGECPRAFAPEQSLAAFVGEVADGEWTLTVTDNAGADTGTINGFAIALNNRPGQAEVAAKQLAQ